MDATTDHYLIFETAAGFCGIAAWSWDYKRHTEIEQARKELAEYGITDKNYSPEPITLTFLQRQAEALSEVWHITPEQASKPVDLFRDGERL